MTPGLVALHGGGEYARGDEAAMDALVEAARAAAAGRGRDRPRIALVPVAAARHRPDLALVHGRAAFEAAAARAGLGVAVDDVPVVDAASAADAGHAAALAAADLVHLPGGDPHVVVEVLAGSAAWTAMRAAHAAGACLAGASAGAMAFAARTWSPRGPMAALGLVPGLAVLPHWDPARLAPWRAATGEDLAWLGLDERTLVLGRPGVPGWRVAGAGAAHLVLPGGAAPAASARHGGTLDLPPGGPAA